MTGGMQSMLNPAGVEAQRVAELFWTILGPAVFVWLLLMGAAIYGIRGQVHARRAGHFWIVGGGVIFPTVALLVFAYWGFSLMTELRGQDADRQVHVIGERFWWRVRYPGPEAETAVETANELWLPRGERIEVILTTADVIHSFWVPTLAGKVDMIPGRANRLVLEPTRNGFFRGQCAEFCGDSHALMSLTVRVVDPPQFETWLATQAEDAPLPATPLERRGQQLFLGAGCGGCHRIGGTLANGTIGPDLTHFGSRPTIAAAMYPNEPEHLARWIHAAGELKPEALMPSFNNLDDEKLDAVVNYLGSLQ